MRWRGRRRRTRRFEKGVGWFGSGFRFVGPLKRLISRRKHTKNTLETTPHRITAVPATQATQAQLDSAHPSASASNHVGQLLGLYTMVSIPAHARTLLDGFPMPICYLNSYCMHPINRLDHDTNSNNWLLDRPQLELARKEDLRYATRLQCAAIGVFFSNRKCLSLSLTIGHPLGIVQHSTDGV